ncbi:MAG TPA: hypothetical protein PK580_06375 [Nitrosomonas halophila]|nr:hypothetical protein [Nitrosomonas halophila]
MLRKKETSILFMSLFMGLAGGFLSHQGLPTLSASEQEIPPNSRNALPHTPRIATEALILTDQSGTPRARLEITAAGEPQLVLLNKKGTPLAQLGTPNAGLPELVLNDNEGKSRIRVAMTADGSPELELHDAKGEGRAALFFVDHNPRLLLRDQEEKLEVTMEAIPDQPALTIQKDGKTRAALAPDHLLLTDKDNTPRLSLRVHQGGEPSISLKDNEGSRLVSLSIQPLPKTEEPLFALYDKKDRLRAGLNLDEEGRPNFILRDGPLLSLVDKAGKNGVYLSLEKDDRPSVYLSALNGQREAFLGLRKKGELALDFMNGSAFPRASLLLDNEGAPLLQLRSKDEKLLWSAPASERSQP